MSNYNHKQFIDWLNTEVEKQEQTDNKLLVEAKLSKYWKKRAARRAKNAKRNWPNSTDRNWALEQQNKSHSINDSIQKLFEKELEDSEGIVDDASEVIRKIKKERERLKIKKEVAKLMKPQEKLKKKKSLSKPYPPHKKGETVGGYYKKAAKKLGGIAAAPGETIGPLQEQLQLNTFGDLKKTISGVMNKEKVKAAGGVAANLAIDQVLGLIPGASNAKSAFDFFKSIYSATDDKKTNTFLDKINVDDKYAEIVDDKVEMAFLKYLSDLFSRKPDQEPIPDDFDVNKELEIYLKNKYASRSLTNSSQG